MTQKGNAWTLWSIEPQYTILKFSEMIFEFIDNVVIVSIVSYSLIWLSKMCSVQYAHGCSEFN